MATGSGAKRLKKLVDDGEKLAVIAVSLGCTTTTVYNLIAGGHPSLDVANNAKRVYGIPTEAWGFKDDDRRVITK